MSNSVDSREPTDQEILDILQEECAEVIHIISKIRRFGIDEVYEKAGISNKGRLESEVFDVLTMLDWAEDRGIIPTLDIDKLSKHCEAKKDKVRKYCAYGDTSAK